MVADEKVDTDMDRFATIRAGVFFDPITIHRCSEGVNFKFDPHVVAKKLNPDRGSIPFKIRAVQDQVGPISITPALQVIGWGVAGWVTCWERLFRRFLYLVIFLRVVFLRLILDVDLFCRDPITRVIG